MKDFNHIFLHSLKSYIDIDIENLMKKKENYLLKLQIQKWKREKLLVWEYHYIVCMKNQTFPQISYIVIEFILRLICSYVFYPDYGKDKFHSQYMECLVQKLIHFNHYFNLKCKKSQNVNISTIFWCQKWCQWCFLTSFDTISTIL